VRTALEALEAGVSRVRITDLDGVTSGGGTVFVASPAAGLPPDSTALPV